MEGGFMENCVFCEEFMKNKKMLFDNKLAIAYFDGFPVSQRTYFNYYQKACKDFF